MVLARSAGGVRSAYSPQGNGVSFPDFRTPANEGATLLPRDKGRAAPGLGPRCRWAHGQGWAAPPLTGVSPDTHARFLSSCSGPQPPVLGRL